MGSQKGGDQRGEGAAGEDRVEAKIDRDLKDSFPASDPPGWVLGVKRRGEEEAAGGPSDVALDDKEA
ncbi:MAG TPA: hypothetical protein VG148_04195 [Pyrinomonadaceae bacterium]|nr:hypothetical protein [Pyrinomonadaceae bacterium]